MSRRRVVVTGLGLISPVGNSVAEGWGNLLAGRSGIDKITRFDASDLPCRIACEVKRGDGSNGTLILKGFLWWAGHDVKRAPAKP